MELPVADALLSSRCSAVRQKQRPEFQRAEGTAEVQPQPWNQAPREEHRLHRPAPAMPTGLHWLSVRTAPGLQTTPQLPLGTLCWPAGPPGEADGQGTGERYSSSLPPGSFRKPGSALRSSPNSYPASSPKTCQTLQATPPARPGSCN